VEISYRLRYCKRYRIYPLTTLPLKTLQTGVSKAYTTTIRNSHHSKVHVWSQHMIQAHILRRTQQGTTRLERSDREASKGPENCYAKYYWRHEIHSY
jgi:hypothetical protein